MNDHALFIEDQKDFEAIQPAWMDLGLNEAMRIGLPPGHPGKGFDIWAEFAVFYMLGA